MTQQTAMMQLLEYILVDCRNENGTIQFHSQETFNKFLEMEKEQIIKAASNDKVFQIAKYLVDGEESNLSLFEWRNMIKRDAEQYYNETYNK
jgi:hypothetical protein